MSSDTKPPPVLVQDRLPAGEERDAKLWYYNSTVQPTEYEEDVPAYARIVTELVASACPRSVLEFGCNAGRNLDLVRRLSPDARLVGIDLNPLAIAKGREIFSLDLRVGDETALARFGDAEFDVTFTVSVFDHIPDIGSPSRELVRVTGCYLVLYEITYERPGKVAKMTDPDGSLVEGYPYSYFHDYREVFERRLGCPCLLDAYIPIARGNLLDMYRLYVFATREKPHSGLPHLRKIELRPLPK